MEAQREEIITLLYVKMPFPQIMKDVKTSLSKIYRVKTV